LRGRGGAFPPRFRWYRARPAGSDPGRGGPPPQYFSGRVETRDGEGRGRAGLAGFPKTLTFGEVPFTPQAKRVLELSIEEARQLGHNYIGTEHLLLGLMKEGQSIAAKILESLGARLDEVRQETLALLGDQYYPRPKKRSQTPVLDEFARDLTQLARESKLDPVIGREQEIERVIQILARRTKNNPVLIGEPGVGKTPS
jgi:ATP-dependent Clp protease ATP-binding subunit ClpC